MKHFCICGHGRLVQSVTDKRPCLLGNCKCAEYRDRAHQSHPDVLPSEDLPDEAYTADDFRDNYFTRDR